MIKRPCAIALNSKADCILVADKFGDVYALPLIEGTPFTSIQEIKKPKQNAAPFKPAATNLTVHSGRNLKSLESQKKQAELMKVGEAREKESMDFDHELLLGHVSMLTDIASASLSTKTGSREYIITADRDEHIRISRGRPQAHIIEGYCFGHAQFVSKLCFANDNVLISGGGENELFVWDWPHNLLLARLAFRDAVIKHSQQHSLPSPETTAVSGIWAQTIGANPSKVSIYCALEGMSALFVFNVDLGSLPENEHVPIVIADFAGNVLDVVPVGARSTPDLEGRDIIVSVDNVHNKNTTTARESTDEAGRLNDAKGRNLFLQDNRGDIVTPDDLKQLTDLLYSIEKLRKRNTEEE